MASRFNVLVFGELDEVENIVDGGGLTDSEVQAVVLNLIRRVRRLEEHKEPEDVPAENSGETDEF